MNAALIAGCIWALLSTVVALLPMRLQYVPGLTLLILTLPLLAWIAVSIGIWVALIALLAALSLFRHPLIWMARRAKARLAGDGA